MSAAPKTRYYVSVMLAHYYSIWIEAESATDAIAIGHEKWDTNRDEFENDCNEIQSIDVVDWEDVA